MGATTAAGRLRETCDRTRIDLSGVEDVDLGAIAQRVADERDEPAVVLGGRTGTRRDRRLARVDAVGIAKSLLVAGLEVHAHDAVEQEPAGLRGHRPHVAVAAARGAIRDRRKLADLLE